MDLNVPVRGRATTRLLDRYTPLCAKSHPPKLRASPGKGCQSTSHWVNDFARVLWPAGVQHHSVGEVAGGQWPHVLFQLSDAATQISLHLTFPVHDA